MRKPAGPYAALCTPFDESGALDLDSLTKLVEFGIANGVTGFLCTALAGEVDQLKLEERRIVATTVLEVTAGRVPVIAGLGSGPLDDVISLARVAERTGAAAVLLPAQLGWDNAEAVPTHDIARLADAVGLEVMLQEARRYAPRAYGVALLSDGCEYLGSRASLKIEGGTVGLEHIRRTLTAVPIWGGDGGLFLLEDLRAGAFGVIPGLEVIDVLARAYSLELDRRPGDADAVLRTAQPLLLNEMQSQASYVMGAKRVLKARGLISSPTSRMPGPPLSPRACDAIDRSLEFALAVPTVEYP